MTAYEDTIEFTGKGAFALDSGGLSLQDTVNFEGKGAVAMVSGAFSGVIAFTGKGAVAIDSGGLSLYDTLTFTGNGEFLPLHSYIFTDVDNFLIEGWRVSKTIQDVLWKFSGRIDKLTTPSYFKNFVALADDHLDVENIVFLGFIPGAGYTLATAADKVTLNAYDYGWYLSSQFVPESIRITDEDTNPSDTIKTLLGGEVNWVVTTGIEPYQIRDVSDWATTKKPFLWDSKTSKWKAIQEICEYTHHVFMVKWHKTANDEYYSIAYFVHEDEIDTYLDLPAMVTVTSPDSYLMSGVRIEDKQEEKYNRVICKGANKITGDWFDKTIESAGVTAGDELPIEYVYESTDMDDQTKTDTKAQELYDFFHTVAKVYSASFKKRMDLQLYQKIKFVGYDNIATDEMRITGISYRRSIAEDIVDIQFTPDQKLSDLRKLIRSMGADFMSEQQRIKEDFFIDLTKIAMGTTQEVISANEANFTLEKDAGLVNARTIEEMSIGDAAMLFPLEGMKDNIVGLKVISGAIEGDYTSWTLKCTSTLTNGLRDYQPFAYFIDTKNEVLVINWQDTDGYFRFGIYNLEDLSVVFESSAGSHYTEDTPDNLYDESVRFGFVDMGCGSFSRSLQSYVLLLREGYETIEVWRGGSAYLWARNIYGDLGDRYAEYGAISSTGKWIVIGSDLYVEGAYYNLQIAVYEGS